MVTDGIIFGILAITTGLGYILRVPLIIMLAGFGMILFGFSLWTDYSWLSIILVLVGAVLIWLGAKS